MQPMMMGPRDFMPAAELSEAYSYDVRDRRAHRAEAARAQVWFEIESTQVYGPRGETKGCEPRVMFKMRSFSDPQAVFSVPKMPNHEQAYPRAWAAFVAGQEDVPDGTLIDELPRVSRMTRETLRAMGVLTIEQAADLPDQARQRLGLEGDRVREIARAWIAREAEGEIADIAAENATLKAEIELMRGEMQQHSLEMAALRHVHTMAGVSQQPAAGVLAAAVSVNPDPNYDDLPGADALAGDGDDDDDGFDDLTRMA